MLGLNVDSNWEQFIKPSTEGSGFDQTTLSF